MDPRVIQQTPPITPISLDEERPRPFSQLLSDEIEEEEEMEPTDLMELPFTPYFPPLTATLLPSSPIKAPVAQIMEVIHPEIHSLKEKGVMKIEIALQSELLGDVVINVDHYDADPHSFHITFSTHSSHEALLAKQIAPLALALQKSFPSSNFTLFARPLPYKVEVAKSGRICYRRVKSVKNEGDSCG